MSRSRKANDYSQIKVVWKTPDGQPPKLTLEQFAYAMTGGSVDDLVEMFLREMAEKAWEKKEK